MGDRGHSRHGPKKTEAAAPLGGGGWVLVLHNLAWAEAYLRTKWHLDPSSRLATIDMGRKLGRGCAPFLGRGAGSPSSTMWPWPRPTCIPSGILIHPAVRPQYTVTDRQTDRQDRTERQRSDSIGRTVLQRVAQKPTKCMLSNYQ